MAVKLKPISTEAFLRGGQAREGKRIEKEAEDARKKEEALAGRFNIGNSLASAALAFVTSGGNPLAAAAAAASAGSQGSGKGAPSALQSGLQGVSTGATAKSLTSGVPEGAGLVEKGTGFLKAVSQPENLQKTSAFLSTVGAGEDITKPLSTVGALTAQEGAAKKKAAGVSALDTSKVLVANQIQRIASADLPGLDVISAEVRNNPKITGADSLKVSTAITNRKNKLIDIKQTEADRTSKEKVAAAKEKKATAKQEKTDIKAVKVEAEKTAKAVKVEEEKTAKKESATESSKIINELKSFSTKLPTSILGKGFFGGESDKPDKTAVTQLEVRIKSLSDRIDRVQNSATMSPADKTKVVSEIQKLISKMKKLVLGEEVTSAITESQAVA